MACGSGDYGKAPPPAAAASYSVPLVAAPRFPNAVKWSEDNLIAVATSRLVTILNPASLDGPRGFVPISSHPPYDVGTVQSADLHAPCLFPTYLSRDMNGEARCIEWSPQGLSVNGGCLLAVCTTDYRVKLYRIPYCEFQSEWIEVFDLSDIMYSYSCLHRFNEVYKRENIENALVCGEKNLQSSHEPQHRKEWKRKVEEDGCVQRLDAVYTGVEDLAVNHLSGLEEGGGSSKVKSVCKKMPFIRRKDAKQRKPGDTKHLDVQGPLCPYPLASSADLLDPSCHESITQYFPQGKKEQIMPYVSSSVYLSRSNLLAHLVVACSPKIRVKRTICISSIRKFEDFVLFAVGSKSGEVFVLRMDYPDFYTVDKVNLTPNVSVLGTFEAHESWVTALSWCKCSNNSHSEEDCNKMVVLATGSSDGSVKIWCGDAKDFDHNVTATCNLSLILIRQVLPSDLRPITTLALSVPSGMQSHVLLAVGRGSGSVASFELSMSADHFREAHIELAHMQMVTGLIWAFDGRCLYSCSQDNTLQAWIFDGDALLPLPFPQECSLLDPEIIDTSSDLPSTFLDCYFGMALSKGSLAIATVQGIETEMLNPMYQSRSLKGVVQLFWVGGQIFNESLRLLLPNQPEAKSIVPGSECLQWESNLLFSLQYFENSIETLVLWDIVASLGFLRIVAGSNFCNRVVAKWLSSWGLQIELQGDDPVLFTEDLQLTLSCTSSRRLHMANVLFRQLYLSGFKPELISGRDLNATSYSFIKVGHQCYANLPLRLSNSQEMLWHNFLDHVEHELRQRLVLLSLHSIACQGQNALTDQLNSEAYSGGSCCGVFRMVEWALANPSGVFSQLLVNKISNTMFKHGSQELCPFCKSIVPFDSVEVASCQGIHIHKLHRCAISFEVTDLGPLWFCSCCARWAVKQSTIALFMLASKQSVQQLSLLSTSYSRRIPWCPFCGLLMQRMLPDSLLKPSLL